jgi:regulator of sigma E protease
MNILVNILSLVVVLGVVVFLHEGGHFLLARLAGARVSVFSLGFGRRLWGFKRGETDYRVSVIPLGGYVRIHGLGPDESDITGSEATSDPLLPRFKRALILLAGPVANAVSAVALVAVALMIGAEVPISLDGPARIGWVEPGSQAAKVGLQRDDLVETIEGKPIAAWRDLEAAIATSPGRALSLGVRRGTELSTVAVTPVARPPYDVGVIGVAPFAAVEVRGVRPGTAGEAAGLQTGDVVRAINGATIVRVEEFVRVVSANAGKDVALSVLRKGGELTISAVPRNEGGRGVLGVIVGEATELRKYSPLQAPVESVRVCVRMTGETFAVIGRMLRGRASIKQMSGPIDIARFSGEAARTGAVPFIWLLGFISLQLAIFNLLPIPVLDGGHLAIIAVEAVIRRDFSERTKERILTVGFWLIVALMIVVLLNDLNKNLAWDKLIPGFAR